MTRTLLILVFIATLIAAWFAPEEGDNDVALSARAVTPRSAPAERPAPSRAAGRRKRDEPVEIMAIRPRGEAGEEGALLFAPISWIPPETKSAPVETVMVPVAEPEPASTTVPPLPFRVLGRYEEEHGRSLVFLQYMDQNLTVAVGDTIADLYRAEKLEDTTLMLRYLPLNELQTLDVGAIQ